MTFKERKTPLEKVNPIKITNLVLIDYYLKY